MRLLPWVAASVVVVGAPWARAQPAEPPGAPAPAAPAPAPAVPAGAAGLAPPPAEATGWVPRPRALPAADAPAPAPWQPFGYLRLAASLVQNDPDVAFVGRADGFDLQNLRAGVRGALGQRARYQVSIDGAVDERDHLNAVNGRLRLGLRDAYADLLLAQALALRAGRFEAWFDPDLDEDDTERAFIDRPLTSRGVLATEGWQARGLVPGRSLGLALRYRGGGALPWAAELAAQNGADELASDNDNDALALSAAARVRARRGWVQLGLRYDPRTEGELPFLQDETDLAVALGAGATIGPIELGAGGVLVRTSFATTGGPAQLAWAAHGAALWRFAIAGLPAAAGYRFAALEPSNLVLTDRVLEHTAGAVLSLPAWRARVQLGAVHVAEQAGRALRNDRLEAALEVEL